MIEAPDWLPVDVSRETLEKLGAYKGLLEKWTRKINLISKSTLDDIVTRHLWDSAQIYEKTSGKWADLGSGGGLPGIVIAVLAVGRGDSLDLTLIESDQRKATFLRTCARELELPISIIPKRIDAVEAQNADIVSARALADLNHLIELSFPHLSESGTGVFMKGAQWQAEIDEARKNWLFSYEATPSKTNAKAAILRIRDIQRV